MSRLRSMIVLVAVLSITGNQPSFGQIIRFAQISDAHIYGSRNNNTDNHAENERGLRWAIDEINRRNEIGPKYDFVVFTGDLNLEVVLKSVPSLNELSEKYDKKYDQLYSDLERNFKPDQNVLLNREIDDSLREPVRQFRDFLSKSDVKVWILLPGNNDLMDEMPITVSCFHKFVRRLQYELGKSKTILDFAPEKSKQASLVLGNCHFFGFENASFKNNNTTNYLEKVEGVQKGILNDLKDEMEHSKPLTASRNSDPHYYAYIFCHIPDVSDPYLHSMNDEELRKKLDNPGNRKSDGPFRRSAWTVTDETRELWNKIIEHKELKGVFAGHFHSHVRSQYQSLNWVKGPEYPSMLSHKLMICPPIAIKDQVIEPEKARGFRDVSVSNETGAVTSEIVWLEK
jgi:3',5'-cyclic AMP phosphodiesterase CpdA